MGTTWVLYGPEYGPHVGNPIWDPYDSAPKIHIGPTCASPYLYPGFTHMAPIWASPCLSHINMPMSYPDDTHMVPRWVDPDGSHRAGPYGSQMGYIWDTYGLILAHMPRLHPYGTHMECYLGRLNPQ